MVAKALRAFETARPLRLEALEVQVFDTAPGQLHLRYLATGDIDALRWPDGAPSQRRDGLWQSTCFEAFVRRSGEVAYLEYNFSPSTEWAAYSFTSYREGVADLRIASPEIHLDGGEDWVAVEVKAALPEGWDGPLECNLTAVIEAADGTKSYWALAHPADKPDFHDPDCFVLALPAPSEA